MTELSIAPARPWRFAVNAALVVGLALVVVAGAALPSQAAEDVRLTQPGSGARVDGPTQVRVEVDTRPLEEVQWVEARLRRNGDIVGSAARLAHQGGERSGGTSTWTASWDPASGWINGGGSLANGSYRLEARARSELGLGEGETTAWRGHSVTVSQPATAPELQAELSDGGRAVALQWSEAASPDFVRYELERAEDGGAFDTVTRISQRGDTAHRDEPPGAGTWHYRVTTVRRDGGGGETSATSGTATVEIAGDDDGDDDESPSSADDSDDSGLTPSDDGGDGNGGNGGNSSSGGDGGDGGNGGQTGDGDGDGDGSDGQRTDGSSSGRSAEPGLREGRDPPPSAGQSSVPQLDGEEAEAEDPVADESADDGFSAELPYDDPEPEGGDEREAEIAGADTPQDRGVITVGDQEFALERALPPMAGGLLLFVTAGHVLRLRQRLE